MVVASCAEEAIFLVYHALLGPGDRAVVETPCYESALQLARSTGAEVAEWHRAFAEGWGYDLDALGRRLTPGTRLLYVNQPHNPTGTLMDGATFDRLVGMVQERGIRLFSDEVYRGLEYAPGDRLPAACDRDRRAVSMGSVSKSYGLPGLRIGWIACHDEALRRRVIDLKHYTTICASAPSEELAALALRHGPELLDRNRELVRANLDLLDGFLARQAATFAWVRPLAGPIGFPRVSGAGDVDALCARLAAAGVLLLPGVGVRRARARPAGLRPGQPARGAGGSREGAGRGRLSPGRRRLRRRPRAPPAPAVRGTPPTSAGRRSPCCPGRPASRPHRR